MRRRSVYPDKPAMLLQWADAQQKLFALQKQQLERYCTGLFGYFCLVESLAEQSGLEAVCKQQNVLRLTSEWPLQLTRPGAVAPLYAEPHQLPFPDDSIDLVVIHHLLEGVGHPHALVREAARVVIAEGKLVIFGSNPFSFGGVRYLANRALKRGWRHHMPLSYRICDWLKLLGFNDMQVSYQYPLIHQPGDISGHKSRQLLQRMSTRTLLPLAGSWCVIATKHKMAKIISNPLARPHLSRIRTQAARRNGLQP